MLPTTTLTGPRGPLTVGRLAIGGNPFSGISHKNRSRDLEMVDYFSTARIKETLHECERNGITAFFGRADNHIMRTLREYWNEGGTIRWFAQTAPERRSLLDNIRQAAGSGASAIYIHGGTAGDFWKREDWTGFVEARDLIRSLGLPAGCAAHYPDLHAARQAAGVDLDFCMQSLYNLEGRQGRIHEHDEEKEKFDPADRIPALEAIAANPEPVVAYKVLGAGRVTPKDALPEVVRYLKPSDLVLMGMCPDTNPGMIAENAALMAELLG